MLGFTRTGCFFTGVVMGFILALALVFFVVCQCDPGFRDSIRQIWTSVKSGVDNTLDASRKPVASPPAEPQIPQGKPAPRGAVPAPPPAPRPAAPPADRPRPADQAPPPAGIRIDL